MEHCHSEAAAGDRGGRKAAASLGRHGATRPSGSPTTPQSAAVASHSAGGWAAPVCHFRRGIDGDPPLLAVTRRGAASTARAVAGPAEVTGAMAVAATAVRVYDRPLGDALRRGGSGGVAPAADERPPSATAAAAANPAATSVPPPPSNIGTLLPPPPTPPPPPRHRCRPPTLPQAPRCRGRRTPMPPPCRRRQHCRHHRATAAAHQRRRIHSRGGQNHVATAAAAAASTTTIPTASSPLRHHQTTTFSNRHRHTHHMYPARAAPRWAATRPARQCCQPASCSAPNGDASRPP